MAGYSEKWTMTQNMEFNIATAILAIIAGAACSALCVFQTMGMALLLSIADGDPTTSGGYFAMGLMVSLIAGVIAAIAGGAVVVLKRRDSGLTHVSRLSDEDAAQEKLFQIHYWPENYEERDEFKEKTGMRSQMVSQRAISGDDVYSQLTEWYLSVLDSPKVPSGMELFFVKDDSELFWKTESKAE